MKVKNKEDELLEIADNITIQIKLIKAKIKGIMGEGEVAEPGYTLMQICRRNQIEALQRTLDCLHNSFADLKESTSETEKSSSEN